LNIEHPENKMVQSNINYQYVAPDRVALSKALKTFEYRPLISVLVPTYNTHEPFLRACLDSVINQIYPHWELCIAHDPQALEDYRKRFPTQIKVTESKRLISATTNAALALATGEFVAVLESEDLLTEDALFEVVKHLNEQTDEPIDLIYSDEDRWDEALGRFDGPFFKPDWAPENLKGQMYIGRLSVYRKSLVDGFRQGVEGSQDWDLALRVTEKARCIRHIPKILYHWRKYSHSSAAHNAVQAGLKAVQDALDREGEGGRAVLNSINSRVLVHYPVKNKPLVSIIIPTKDKADLLTPCLDSITRNTDYPNWEIIVVDNGSKEPETFQLFDSYRKRLGGDRFKVLQELSPFNFSYLVNQGVKAAQGSMILLLNNDTELISPTNWLEEMVGYAQREAIACVGCKLLYFDNTIQHAGVICGIGCIARHSHLNFPVQSPGYFDRLTFVANYSAVTGACLMIKRSLWEKVSGFEEQLVVGANDVDFCLRLLKQGYRHVVLPHVLFYHHESKSRGEMDTPSQQLRVAQEIEFMQRRWPKICEPDPYYSPHLNHNQKTAGDFSISPNSIYAVRGEKTGNGGNSLLKRLAVILLPRKAINKLRVLYYRAKLLMNF
jgi:GT2 family glycosyltransferase